MRDPRYPSLYQINTRVWLTELSRTLGRPATLDDIPDAELDRLAAIGLRLGLAAERLADRAGRAAGLAQPTRSGAGVQETLPDLREEDIAGSGFAITGYTVHTRSRRRRRAGPPARAAAQARPAADARFRAQPHGASITLGRRASRYYVAGHRARPGPRPAELLPGCRRQAATCCWPTAATRTSPAGPTRCSSTTATRPRRRR